MHRRARAACPGVFEPTIEHSTLRAPVTVNQIEALVVTGCSHGREQVKGAGAPCFRRACAAPLGGCCASGRGLVSADLQATLVDKNLFPLGPPSSPLQGPAPQSSPVLPARGSTAVSTSRRGLTVSKERSGRSISRR